MTAPSPSTASARARDLHREAVIWDQHGCLPLDPHTNLDRLDLYRDGGVTFVSINVGFDVLPFAQTMSILTAFRAALLERSSRFLPVRTASDVMEARRDGRLAVAFDLEGTEMLDGDTTLVEELYELGVRTMLIAYNQRNRAGGGCHDDVDTGLTRFGRELVAAMNQVGMLVDATHCSHRTTMELFDVSTAPVVFSHSSPQGVKLHPRNVSDNQMLACAETGGVVGINGVGIFLGDNDSRTRSLVRAVDYAVNIVGPEHVGIGLDYVFDHDELGAFLRDNPGVFPKDGGYADYDRLAFVSPTQLLELTDDLLRLGYGNTAVLGILGGNFLRVASQVWK